MPRRKDGGGIYLRRPRPTQGCRADDDDDDDDDDDEEKSNAQLLKEISDRQN